MNLKEGSGGRGDRCGEEGGKGKRTRSRRKNLACGKNGRTAKGKQERIEGEERTKDRKG